MDGAHKGRTALVFDHLLYVRDTGPLVDRRKPVSG
jgi:hypothetical protein